MTLFRFDDWLNNDSIPVDLDLLELVGSAILSGQDLLTVFAKRTGFEDQMTQIFSNESDTSSFLSPYQSYQEAWLNNNFTILSNIEIRYSEEIGGANGAYSAQTDTIYLSVEFLEENKENIVAIVAVLLEEAGHRIDAQLNPTDTQGDEGQYFSAVVRGETLSTEALQQIQAENDQTTIVLNGQELEIEQNTSQNISWSEVNGGTFGDISNWDNGVVPDSNNQAIFDLSSDGYVVDFSSNVQTKELTIDNDNVTFDLGGNEYLVQSDLAANFALDIGTQEGDIGSLTVLNGTLKALTEDRGTRMGENRNNGGIGNLIINNGGNFITNELAVVRGNVNVLNGSISTGSLKTYGNEDNPVQIVVNGNNSLIEITTTSGVGSDIGSLSGNTELRIENGGNFNSLNSDIRIINDIIITDIGSTLTTRNLLVNPTGNLSVRTGATVTISNEFLLRGNATVTGNGTLLETVSLRIGDNQLPIATLSIEDNAIVRSTGYTRVITDGILTGNGTIQANFENNGGTVAPGITIGDLTIDGGYRQNAQGLLELEIGGTTVDLYDQLLVTGDVNLDGIINISFADDFNPWLGDEFTELITFGGNFQRPLSDVDINVNLPENLTYETLLDNDSLGIKILAEIGGESALSFDGEGDYVEVPNIINGLNAVTIEAWFKYEDANTWRWIYGNGPGFVDVGFAVKAGSNVLRYHWNTTEARFTDQDGSITLTPDTWYHVAYTYDGSTVKAYINGQEDFSRVSSGIISTNTTQAIGGGFWDGNEWFAGTIDEVRIWNEARTQTEVQDNYQQLLVGNETGLIVYFQFDQVTDNITPDFTNNGNYGTVIGATPVSESFPLNYITVTNTNDSGEGSLRWAIEQANSNSGLDKIVFYIEGEGVQTIQPLSALPDITDAVIIDATTQPGYNGKPLIELDGSLAGENSDGLVIRAGDSTVKGLAINRFDRGFALLDNGNNTIQGNFIGTDVTGTTDLGNRREGIYIRSAGNVIGGNNPDEGNLVAGNDGIGIFLQDNVSNENNIINNYIGTDITGIVSISNNLGLNIVNGSNNVIENNLISGNNGAGIGISSAGDFSANNNQILNNYVGVNADITEILGNGNVGVDLPGAIETRIQGNIIGGNSAAGIALRNTQGTIIENNYIGTDGTGTSDLGNPQFGITDDATTIGAVIRNNKIAFNPFAGIRLSGTNALIELNEIYNNGKGLEVDSSSANNTISANSIYDNNQLGIDLESDGVTTNDLGDSDTGANNLQNYPILTSVTTNQSETIITGTFNSNPNQTYKIEFFNSNTGDDSGYGEGEIYLDFLEVTTDNNGDASFSFTLASGLASDSIVTATATDIDGNTSEFSAVEVVVESQGGSVVESDFQALISLYNSTNGVNWTNNSGWTTLTNANVGDWYGVTVESDRVVRVDLINNNLVGNIPTELGDLTDLRNLVLSNNSLTGEIPSQLGNLTGLENLILFNNQLTGNLPVELGNITNLQFLILANNDLIGTIPNQIGNLTNLRGLELYGNQLSGSIPAELGNLTNLQNLVLRSNQLTGSIPTELGNLSNLGNLELWGNQLTGEIPAELGNLVNLQSLNLGGNDLTGTLPIELANLSNLILLSLWETQLAGSIPTEFGNLGKLQVLDLRDSQFNGQIPVELGNLSSLRILNLSRNNFAGEIPEELGSLTNLEEVFLGGNHFVGEIPVSFENLSNLRFLHLYDNQLTGTIPSQLGNISTLQDLWLQNNQLTGEIPLSLGDNQTLQQLQLQNNLLNGVIPDNIINRSWNSLNLENPPFVIEEIPNQNVISGAAYTLDISNNFGDLNNDVTTYSASNLPSGLTLDPNTGIISGTVDSVGSFDITITATDNDGSVSNTFSFAVQSNYDLAVNIVEFSPNNPQPGELLAVTWEVTNTGSEAITGTWDDQVYLSTNPEINNELLLGTFTFTGTIESGQIVQITEVIDIPSDVVGNRYLSVVTDANNNQSEIDETNNNDSILVPFPQLPLSATSGEITGIITAEDESNATREGSYSIDHPLVDIIPNQLVTLQLNSTDFDAYLQLINADTGEVINFDDDRGQELNSRLSFIPEDGINYEVRVTTYNYQDTGNYTITASNDSADLIITNVVAPNNALNGELIQVSLDILNQGTLPTIADEDIYGLNNITQYELYVSEDNVFDPEQDYYLGSPFIFDGRPIIESGDQVEISIAGRLPNNLSEGTNYLFAIADSSNTQIENNETNNIIEIPITINVEFDAYLRELTTPETVTVGENFEINWTYGNQFDALESDYREWSIGFYLSEDETLDDTDILFSSDIPNYSLNGAWSGTRIVNRQIKSSVFEEWGNPRSGNYFIIAKVDYLDEQSETNELNNIQVSSITIAEPVVNLELTTANAPETIILGENFSIDWVVTNTSNVDIPNNFGSTINRIFLSKDTIWDDNDYYLADSSNQPLAAGNNQSLTREITWNQSTVQTVRNELVNDQEPYHLLFIIDPLDEFDESNETDNIYAEPVILRKQPDNLPNLIIEESDTNSNPQSANLGDTITVYWKVTNNGTTPTVSVFNWTDNIYFSEDNTIDENDILLDFLEIYDASIASFFNLENGFLPLEVGESYEASLTINIPFTGLENNYILIATDDENNQNELDENDNVLAIPLTLNVPQTLPNLVISAVNNVPQRANSGETINNVTWTVTNIGGDIVNGGWHDQVYFSEDPFFDESDTRIISIPGNFAGSLATGESYNLTTDITVPNDQKGAYLLFRTDGFDNQFEGNENDNWYVQPLKVDLPNFQVIDASISGSLTLGNSFDLTWLVENTGIGDGLTESFHSFYLSDDPYLDLDDNELNGSQSINSLGSGDIAQFTDTITLFPYLPAGERYLLIETGQGLYETDKSDNVYAVPVTIEGPDLTIIQTATPSTALVNERINIAWEVRNDGSTPLTLNENQYFDRVYFSSDEILDDNDRLLTSQFVNRNLSPQDTYSYTRDVNLPGVAPGTYYIIFDIDADQDNGEISEDNNRVILPITLNAPNLTITEATIPQTNFRIGDNVEVSWTVENIGDYTALANWSDYIYLSEDDTLDVTDRFITSTSVGSETPLDPGNSYTFSRFVEFSRDEIGDRHLLFVTNRTPFSETQGETNLEDNVIAVPVTIDPFYADLIVSEINAPIEGIAGQQVEISWTVTNQGSDDISGSWEDILWLYNGEQTERFLGTFPFTGTILAGTSITRTQVITLPENITGDRRLAVITDSNDTVIELDAEDNNTTFTDQPITILAPQVPNLQVTEIIPPSNAIAGQETVIEWVVINNGDAATTVPEWSDSVWLSSTPTLGFGRVYLGDATNPSFLREGDSYRNSLTVELPETLNGTFYVIVETDSRNDVNEGNNESDNEKASDDTVSITLPPPPNLQVTDISVSPQQGFTGQSVLVTYTVTNTGNGPTLSGVTWEDKIYFSGEQVVGIDIDLGTVQRNQGLQPGESQQVQQNITLPVFDQDPRFANEALLGDRFIFVETDVNNTVFEQELEFDNLSEFTPINVQLTPPPDLEIEIIEEPETTEQEAGEFFAVEYRVTNNGANGTLINTWFDGLYLSTNPNFDPEEFNPETDILLDENLHDGTQPVIIGFLDNSYRDSQGNVIARSVPIYSLPDYSLDPGDSYEERISGRIPEGTEGEFYVFLVTDNQKRVFELERDNNVIGLINNPITIVSRPADLVVSAVNIDLSQPIESDVLVPISWTITNQGTGEVVNKSWTDQIILSEDDFIGNGDDVVLAEINHDSIQGFEGIEYLNPGESEEFQLNIAIPRAVESGEYNLFVVTDADDVVFEDENENNNQSVVFPLTVSQQTPDLQVSGITVDAAVASGGLITVGWTVNNVGSRTANNAETKVYLSTNTTLNSNDIELGTIGQPSIKSGESYQQETQFMVPIDASGEFYVIVETDSKDQVIEGEFEDNNLATSNTLTNVSLSPLPDIEILSVESVANLVSGQSFDVTYTITNNGIATDQEFYNRFYLSRDQFFDPADTYIGYSTHENGLESGEIETRTESFTLPNGLAGRFYVFAIADQRSGQLDVQQETSIVTVSQGGSISRVSRTINTQTADNIYGIFGNIYEREGENNNITYDLTSAEVILPGTAELEVTGVTTPSNATTGDEITITYTVTNLSDNDVLGKWEDGVYLSSDDTWDANDRLITTVQQGGVVGTGNTLLDVFGGLASGDSYTRTVTATLPGVNPGDYHIIVRSDLRNQVPETEDEINAGVSDSSFAVDVPILSLDTPVTGTLEEGQGVYYRVDVEAGETLQVRFDSEATIGSNELYIRYDEVPTRNQFDVAFTDPFSADQTITRPITRPGSYYIYAYANEGIDDPNFTIEADILDFSIVDLSVNAGSNLGQTTVALSGYAFTPGDIISLVDLDGVEFPAIRQWWVDDTEAWATFDLQGLPLGDYDINIKNSQESFTLNDSFTVNDLPIGNVDIQLNAPTALRPGSKGVFTLSYGNNGGTDAFAPPIDLSVNNAYLSSSNVTLGRGSNIGSNLYSSFDGFDDFGLSQIFSDFGSNSDKSFGGSLNNLLGSYSSLTDSFASQNTLGDLVNSHNFLGEFVSSQSNFLDNLENTPEISDGLIGETPEISDGLQGILGPELTPDDIQQTQSQFEDLFNNQSALGDLVGKRATFNNIAANQDRFNSLYINNPDFARLVGSNIDVDSLRTSSRQFKDFIDLTTSVEALPTTQTGLENIYGVQNNLADAITSQFARTEVLGNNFDVAELQAKETQFANILNAENPPTDLTEARTLAQDIANTQNTFANILNDDNSLSAVFDDNFTPEILESSRQQLGTILASESSFESAFNTPNAFDSILGTQNQLTNSFDRQFNLSQELDNNFDLDVIQSQSQDLGDFLDSAGSFSNIVDQQNSIQNLFNAQNSIVNTIGNQLDLSLGGNDFSSFLGSNFSFIGGSGNGPVGILPPGAEESQSFVFKPTIDEGTVSFTASAPNYAASLQADLEWNLLQDAFRITEIQAQAWDAIWLNFLEGVGSTYGDLLTALIDNANYLSQLGIRDLDFGRLLAFELQQASNITTGGPLLSSVDAFDIAPGLSLSMGRTFNSSLPGRYELGDFGRGWSNPWDQTLTGDENGNIILDSSGVGRTFTPIGNGRYVSSVPGDYAVLSEQGNGYQLEQLDGSVSVFQGDGKLSYIEDTNSNRITVNYDGENLASIDHSNGDSLTFNYNELGRISEVTDTAGQVTSYSYDQSGEHLMSVTTPQGTTNYTYDTSDDVRKKNALLSVSSSEGTRHTYEYDSRGRLSREFSNDELDIVTYNYDSAAGIYVTNGVGDTTTLLPNDLGQLIQTRTPSNQTLQLSYDANGNGVGVNSSGNQSFFAYDSRGNLTNSRNPLGQELSFSYDLDFNRLTRVTDARNNPLNYEYDDQGNVSKIIYVDGTEEQFSYDSAGNLTQSVNRGGDTFNYTHNNDGLLTRQELEGYSNHSIDYTYDVQGNLLSATDENGTTSMEYDASDRLTKITYPNGRFLAYTYDADGRRTQMVDHNGFTTNYIYDVAGRLTGLTDASDEVIVTYEYNSAGRLIQETNGNGTYTNYEYDVTGQLTRLVNYAPDGSINSRFDYTYDDFGRRTSMTTLEGTTEYGYDAIGQLITVTLPNGRIIEYEYDDAGNRITVTDDGVTTDYTTNNLNQYTTVDGATYDYDADGNLISKTENGETTTYGYDEENRLVEVVIGSDTWAYEYDALGNRVATVLNGERTEYLVDPAGLGNVVAEYDSNGNLVANYTHGLGLVSRVDNGNSAIFFDYNAIGSTIGLSGVDGSYLNSYSYLPFGEILNRVETIDNDFEYVGQWGVMEEDNGLDFMRARFYDTENGRFLNPDPIGLSGADTNFYRYAKNNPVTFVDPSGKLIPLLAAALVGSVVGAGLATAIVLPNAVTTVGERAREQIINNVDNLFNSEIVTAAENGEWNIGTGETYGVPGAYETTPLFNDPLFGPIDLVHYYSYADIANTLDNLTGTDQGYYLSGFILGDLFEEKQYWEGSPSGRNGVDYITNRLGALSQKYGVNLLDRKYAPLREIIFLRFVKNGLISITDIVAPFDPNDIVGPQGFGEENWISASATLPYTIRFENLETATAPAQQVRITHPLDGDLDIRTFRLGSFGWADFFFEVPDNRAFYSERLDLTEEQGFYVDVFAGIDIINNEAFWTLTTIDPETGQQPENPLVGFLPPNTENGIGDGFVTYTIRPDDESLTGDVIDAEATIFFDSQPPIDTPPIFNTLDADAPTSTLTPLPTVSETPEILLEWTSSDVDGGSGLAGVTVYVSENGGAFVPIIEDTLLTETTFTATPGNIYTFYIEAIDNAGNRQQITSADYITTEIAGGNTPPILTTNLGLILDEAATATITLNELQVTDSEQTAAQLTYILSDIPDNGTLTLDGIALMMGDSYTQEDINSDRLTYLHNGSETLSDSFSFTVNDGDDGNIPVTLFNITVNPVDDLPVVENAIADITVDEDAENYVIDVSNVFSDADDDNILISFNNSNQALINVTLENNVLTINYLENQSGEAIITLTGLANGETVETNFTVTVNPVDDLPVVNNAIADITVDEDAENDIIDVSNLFFDADGDAISISVENSNQALINATLENNILTINYLDNQSGEALITLTGLANGDTIETSFTVTVNPVDEQPTEILGTASADILIGTNNADVIIGKGGGDIITGNGGNDIFKYESFVDGGDIITDFNNGDKIDLSNIMASIGQSGSDALANGVVGVQPSNMGTTITIFGGPFIIVQNTSVEQMNDSTNFIF